jgi:hypothetical protein
MQLKVGSRWKSVADATEVVVVRAPASDVRLECGGYAMAAVGSTFEQVDGPRPGVAGGTAVGKRYSDDARAFELLVTKAGEGSLSIDGVPLTAAEAKKLPSSD